MKNFKLFLMLFCLFFSSNLLAATYSENFEDGTLDEPWEAYKTYYILDGYMHVVEGNDLDSIKESEVSLRLEDEFIYHFEADIKVPGGYDQVVGIKNQWSNIDEFGQEQMYFISLKFVSSINLIQANYGHIYPDGTLTTEQVDLTEGNFDTWYHLGMTIQDNYATFEIDGYETNLFYDIVKTDEIKITENTAAYVHAHNGIPDINYYTDNLVAISKPLSTDSSLLNTTWNQSYPLKFRSDFNNDGVLDDLNNDGILDEWVVGCNAIAVGKLIDYYFKQGYHDLGWLPEIPLADEAETFKIKYVSEKKSTKTVLYTGDGISTEAGYAEEISQDDPNIFEGGELHFIEVVDNFTRDDIYIPYFVANSLDEEKNSLQEFVLWIALGFESSFVLKEECGEIVNETTAKLDKDILVNRFGFKDIIEETDSFYLTQEGIAEHREYITESINNGDPILIKLEGNQYVTCGDKTKLKWTTHTALIDGVKIDSENNILLKFNFGFTNKAADAFYYLYSENEETNYIPVDSNDDGIINFGFKKASLFKNTHPDISLDPDMISVGGHSSHYQDGYYLQFYATDPNKIADTISVQGPGISEPFVLTYQEEDTGMWYSDPLYYLGDTPPDAPAVYTFNLFVENDIFYKDLTIDSFVEEYATNLSPTGEVFGNITFSWTGVSDPEAVYQVQLNNETGRIWDSEKTSTTSIPYSGAPLEINTTYHYDVVTEDGYSNESFNYTEFTYLGESAL